MGEDQASHLELAREITRRFNRFYGPVFPEPQMLLTEIPKLAGTDGRKMSKSFGNAIYLKDSAGGHPQEDLSHGDGYEAEEAVGPRGARRLPGLHSAQGLRGQGDAGWAGCRLPVGESGLPGVQKSGHRQSHQAPHPLLGEAGVYETNPGRVWEILEEGNTKARRAARKTMEDVRSAIGL